MVNDVSRACMYAPCDEDVYVERCDEDREAGEEQMCGKLSKAMYGTRIAAKLWQREAGNTLKGAGFTAGRTSPCQFHHPARDMMVFLHGDDFVSSGSVEDLKLLEKVLSAKYSIKTTTIGEGEKLAKEVRILNRIVRWRPGEGVTIEADPRHLEILVDSTGVKDERPLTTNGSKDDQEKEAGRDLAKGEKLDDNSVSKYRSDVARLNYLAADRPDIAFSVKELARRMSEFDDW